MHEFSFTAVRTDGKWGNWGSWGKCTMSCGRGSQKRTRACDNPPPQHGGAQCTGPLTSTQDCNTQKCPSKTFREFAICNIIQSMSI